MKKNAVVELSTHFALEVITYCEELQNEKKYVVSNQLLKAGTSIGANVAEAQSAESRADFIHKMKLAAKEAQETRYWLYLCQNAATYPSPKSLQLALGDLIKLINRIIVNTKANAR